MKRIPYYLDVKSDRNICLLTVNIGDQVANSRSLFAYILLALRSMYQANNFTVTVLYL